MASLCINVINSAAHSRAVGTTRVGNNVVVANLCGNGNASLSCTGRVGGGVLPLEVQLSKSEFLAPGTDVANNNFFDVFHPFDFLSGVLSPIMVTSTLLVWMQGGPGSGTNVASSEFFNVFHQVAVIGGNAFKI